jgi:hypothetical protein
MVTILYTNVGHEKRLCLGPRVGTQIKIYVPANPNGRQRRNTNDSGIGGVDVAAAVAQCQGNRQFGTLRAPGRSSKSSGSSLRVLANGALPVGIAAQGGHH